MLTKKYAGKAESAVARIFIGSGRGELLHHRLNQQMNNQIGDAGDEGREAAGDQEPQMTGIG